jgi:hypothetical protein
VFGDGPYNEEEHRRYRSLLGEVNATDLAWFLHVGDILSGTCSDAVFTARRDELDALRHPVIYTPGDNEWADCRRGDEPLERLTSLRRFFFATPGQSLGQSRLSLTAQGADSVHGEYVENVRWQRGRVVFATVHMVGSRNAGEPFPSRTEAHDSAAARRTRAAIAWSNAAFDLGLRDSAKLLVLAMHANLGLERADRAGAGYESFVANLMERVRTYAGAVVLIHGDSHTQRFDQPLRDSTGRVAANFARLETFGSPDIGWMRVVVDTAAGQVLEVNPRPMRRPWR